MDRKNLPRERRPDDGEFRTPRIDRDKPGNKAVLLWDGPNSRCKTVACREIREIFVSVSLMPDYKGSIRVG